MTEIDVTYDRVVIWEHPNGQVITIYPDRKVRSGFHWPDEWPVLYRTEVSGLSAEEWYAKPGDDWKAG